MTSWSSSWKIRGLTKNSFRGHSRKHSDSQHFEHQHEQKSDHSVDINDSHSPSFDSSEDEGQTISRQRSRSLGDASDCYYSDQAAFSPNRNGLHYRAAATRIHADDGTVDEEDGASTLHHRDSQHPYPAPFSPNGSHAKQRRKYVSRKHFMTLYGVIRMTFVLGITGYVAILVRETVWLSAYNQPVDQPQTPVESPNRQWAFRQAKEELEQAHGMQQNRAQSRKVLTRMGNAQSLDNPPSTIETVPSPTEHLSWYPLLLDSNQNVGDEPSVSEDDSKASAAAALDQICGFAAQTAYAEHPDQYPERLALNSQAKVVITGIVSNPVAFSLALTLATKCGVSQIMGIDHMFPNTVQHRLEMQERVEILTTNIPKLSKPIILPYVGLDPQTKKPSSSQGSTEESGIMNFLKSFEPTHVVHMAWMERTMQLRSDWTNTHSPYVDESRNPPMFSIRNSAVSMQQLLAYIATVPSSDRPQLIYSSTPQPNELSDDTALSVHAKTKAFDEIMSATYHEQIGLPSIGLRFQQHGIYGQWSLRGTHLHDTIESCLDSFYGDSAKMPTFQHELEIADGDFDLIHVDDAVNAIVAVMQFQAKTATTAEISSGGPKQSTATIKDAILTLVNPETTPASDLLQSLKQKSHIPVQKFSPTPLNGWTPQVSLYDGLLKTIAWHLDRRSPFGNPNARRNEKDDGLDLTSGDAFLKRHDHLTCHSDDITCHQSRNFLPCISECNTREQCLPSVFDSVQHLLKTLTEGCRTILYTQSLGHNPKELPLHTEYMDEETVDEKTPLICNLAFVPRDSKIVETVANKVPEEQLVKFGVVPYESDADHPGAFHRRKLDELNGKVLYHGWILVWVDGGMEPLSITDKSILKLSPGNLFHPDVKSTFFVADNFATSPRIDDVQFLIGEMKRDAFAKRTVEKTMRVVDPDTKKSKEKKIKYRMPGEPKRRAAILFAPLRHPQTIAVDTSKKLSVNDASKFMRYEIDLDLDDKEPPEIRRQREFYERLPSYINSAVQRSDMEPWYRYSMRHWVRTRWVVHDLSLEESRQLRCEWYQEHVQWGADLDQLSFAHVMAKMELERRIAHEEPDDHIRTFIDQYPDLRDLTDSYEWHAMDTENNRLFHEPMMWTAQLPDHIDKAGWDRAHGHIEDLRQAQLSASQVPLFVRILSERMMALSRRAWTRLQQKRAKHKKH